MNDISQEKYDFYELIDEFIEEGYSAEEAEELAYQRNFVSWAEPEAEAESIAEAIVAESVAESVAEQCSDRADDEIPF